MGIDSEVEVVTAAEELTVTLEGMDRQIPEEERATNVIDQDAAEVNLVIDIVETMPMEEAMAIMTESRARRLQRRRDAVEIGAEIAKTITAMATMGEITTMQTATSDNKNSVR